MSQVFYEERLTLGVCEELIRIFNKGILTAQSIFIILWESL